MRKSPVHRIQSFQLGERSNLDKASPKDRLSRPTKADNRDATKMDRINRWKLADELNVYQIALLIVGYDPCEFEADQYDRWLEEVKFEITPF